MIELTSINGKILYVNYRDIMYILQSDNITLVYVDSDTYLEVRESPKLVAARIAEKRVDDIRLQKVIGER